MHILCYGNLYTATAIYTFCYVTVAVNCTVADPESGVQGQGPGCILEVHWFHHPPHGRHVCQLLHPRSHGHLGEGVPDS